LEIKHVPTTASRSKRPSATVATEISPAFQSAEPANPNYRKRVQQIFDKAHFMRSVGIKLADVGPGWCEAGVEIQDKHLQQDDFVHAGVLASLADHTAGAAATTMISAERIVLTVEFKINLLRPALGESLRCRSELLKAGRRLIIAESSIYARQNDKEKLVAKAMVTLAPV